MAKKKVGKITEPPKANIRDHERRSAETLALAGHNIEWIRESDRDFTKTPDFWLNGVRWELKSPKTNKLSQIENNLKKANRKSDSIIIDSQRVYGIPDKIVESFLARRLKKQKSIKRLWLITKRRKIIDIGDIV